MNKKNDLKILKFPNHVAKLERQVEAILFAAEEPLDMESIQEKLNIKVSTDNLHDALYDCTITKECIIKGMDQGIF